MDRWFEESMPIYVHPKDPFKRVDVLPSTRHVQVYINDVKVADSKSSMHLYETGLPARFYLPLTDVDASKLRPSKTKTQCPYKGEAEYYSVDTGKGGVATDVVWFYERPTLECAKIEGELLTEADGIDTAANTYNPPGLLCFYNEKVDIKLDGEWLEKPKSPFS